MISEIRSTLGLFQPGIRELSGFRVGFRFRNFDFQVSGRISKCLNRGSQKEAARNETKMLWLAGERSYFLFTRESRKLRLLISYLFLETRDKKSTNMSPRLLEDEVPVLESRVFFEKFCRDPKYPEIFFWQIFHIRWSSYWKKSTGIPISYPSEFFVAVREILTRKTSLPAWQCQVVSLISLFWDEDKKYGIFCILTNSLNILRLRRAFT